MEWIDTLLGRLPVLHKRLRPNVAAFWGFMTGGLGLAIYCHSFVELLIVIFLNGVVGAAAPLALPAIWALCGIWGYIRVSESNKQLAAAVGAVAIAPNITGSGAVLPPPAQNTPGPIVQHVEPDSENDWWDTNETVATGPVTASPSPEPVWWSEAGSTEQPSIADFWNHTDQSGIAQMPSNGNDHSGK